MTGPGAGATRREEWLDLAQERPDEERDIETGAEDAKYRSRRDAKKAREAPPGK